MHIISKASKVKGFNWSDKNSGGLQYINIPSIVTPGRRRQSKTSVLSTNADWWQITIHFWSAFCWLWRAFSIAVYPVWSLGFRKSMTRTEEYHSWLLRVYCILTFCMLVNFILLVSSADFFQSHFFSKNLSGTVSAYQTVWTQIRNDILSVLTWVQTVWLQKSPLARKETRYHLL